MATLGTTSSSSVYEQHFNVKDFGATGDSTTDDTAAIQAAIDACDPNRGGAVFFPQGRYRITDTLDIANQGTWLVGEGSPGTATAFALGSSRIISDNGVTAISCASGGHATLGYGFRNLHVVAASGATTGNGILITNAEKTIVENVTCSDYVGGYGMRLAGGAGNAQYAHLVNFGAGNCLTGLHLNGTGPNGLRMFGGYFEGANDPATGSVAIHIETGDTARIFGTVIAGWETGIYVQSAAVAHQIYGARFEYCNIGIRIGASAVGNMVVGCDFDNALLTGGGAATGIQVDSGAANTVLLPGWMSASVVPKVSDAGTDTLYWTNNGTQPFVFFPGTVGVNGATGTHMGGGVGVLAIKNADTAPTTNPTGGGVAYVQNGALKYRGTAGAVTTLGVSDPGEFTAINAKDYGAVGNGTADDTAAIQAAIDAAAAQNTLGIGTIIGNVVYLPRGVYKVTNTITVKNYVRLVGGGYNTSMIIADASFPTDTPIVKLGAGGGDSNGTKLEHIRVNCNNVAGSIGIYCDDLNEGSGVYWSEVRNFRDIGIYMTACANAGIHYTGAVASSSGGDACIFLENNAGVIHLQQLSNLMGIIASPTTVDAIRVDSSLFTANTIHCEHVGNGFNLVDGFGGNIFGLQGHTSVTNLIHLQSTFPGIVAACFIDKSGGTNLIVDDVRGVTDTTNMRPFWVTHLSGHPDYTITNATTDRAFNANSYTTDELADVLGTLIADLQSAGILS